MSFDMNFYIKKRCTKSFQRRGGIPITSDKAD